MRILFSAILVFRLLMLHSQIQLTDDTHEITLLEVISFDEPVRHDQDIRSTDSPWVVVFKEYFNPNDFDTYKTFFLSRDWGGFTREEFNSWQAFLDTNFILLHQVLHVRHTSGQEFFIGQYNVETKGYTIPESVKFKNVNGQWKHIHARHDELFPLLHAVGQIQPAALRSMTASGTPKIYLRQLGTDQFSRVSEKFNREALFENLLPVLTAHSISATDLQIARQLFLEKNDQACIEFITQHYPLQDIDLMEDINTRAGFTLFNFTRALKD